jgi:hypothetical protein
MCGYKCAVCGKWYPPFSMHEYICEERAERKKDRTARKAAGK